MIRAATLVVVVFTAVLPVPLAAQSYKEHKAAHERLLEARRSGDLGTYLAAAAIVGLHKTSSKGLMVVLENLGSFSSDLTPEGLDAITETVADLLEARLQKVLAPWEKRFRRDLEAPKARKARARILAKERKRVEQVAAKVNHWFGRVALMEGRRRREGDAVVFAALRDEDPRVVRRAVDRLRGRKELRIIEEVVASYRQHKDQTGRQWDRTFFKMKALCASACGEDRPSVADYQSWLASHRDLDDPFAAKKARKTHSRPARTGLFGLRVTGNAIVFVLDVSGSMNAIDRTARRRVPERGRTGTAADAAADAVALQAQNTRLERSKRELMSTIRRLPEGVHFNVITYSSPRHVKAWQKSLVPATAEAKDALAESIEGLTAGGSTATDVALELAFDDTMLDTIYLISDGVPTHQGMRAGQLPSDTVSLTQAILEGVRARNLLRDVRVFTLGFPQVEKGYSFLRELAAENDGRFIKIGASEDAEAR